MKATTVKFDVLDASQKNPEKGVEREKEEAVLTMIYPEESRKGS